jgi:hypothetical protein
MLFAAMANCVKNKIEIRDHVKHNINEIVNYLDFIEAVSEDEAYGKAMKFILKTHPDHEEWTGHFVMVKKVPTP